jgi:hypothetical protein
MRECSCSVIVCETKVCSKCNQVKHLCQFYVKYKGQEIRHSKCKNCTKEYNSRWYSDNKDRVKEKKSTPEALKQHAEYERSRRQSNPEMYLLHWAKSRAKKENLPFNLSLEDIRLPEYCPVLGIKLSKQANTRDYSYSLDKLVPEKGYVRGNISVMSFRANRIKYNASIEEMQAIVKFVRTLNEK